MWLHPHDFGDWIRLGEMALAADRPEVAQRAYVRAMREAPRDQHVAFQLAQSLKRVGRDEDALAMFKLALQLSERAPAEPMEAVAAAVAIPPKGMVLYSVQDLIGYLTNHATVTGIQRVQLGIVGHVMATQGDTAGFVLTDAEPGLERGDFWLVDPDALAAVLREAEAPQTNHARLKARIADCRRTARAIRPGAGHTLILLGAFWALGNAPHRYFAAKRRGARIGAYLYDLIPISHPQFCEMELSLHFRVSFGQMAAIADFILTISEDTAKQVCALLEKHGRAPIPVTAVPLAHQMARPDDPVAPTSHNPRPFVAYVSTIEARKNHIYVVRVWQRLIAQGIDVPDLMFVGRLGWKIAPLMALLSETGNLGGRVRIQHGLTDAELRAVYRGARFTVFTSFVEGWGLPIGESLAQGTPCVASRTSSMPEVGGDLVDYVDPFDLEDGVAVIGRLLTDPQALAARRQQLAEDFAHRTWDNVGEHFVAAVENAVALPARPPVPPELKAGQVIRPSAFEDEFDLETVLRTPRGLMFADGFGAPDDHGVHPTGPSADIRFQSDLPPGTPVRLVLDLRARESTAGSVSLETGRSRMAVLVSSLPSLDGPATPVLLDSSVGNDGTVTVKLMVDRPEGSSPGLEVTLVALSHQRADVGANGPS